MAAPPVEIPCEPWTTPEEVRLCCNGLDPAYDLTVAIQFATAILYRLSGRQFPGECERTIWPCKGDNCGCCSSLWGSLVGSDWWWAFNNFPTYPVPNGLGSGFLNIGRCSKRCHLPCIDLPATVNDIVAIWVDGVLLPATAYKIEAYRRVCRIDGEGWPCTNDLTGEPGDPGTWTITYSYGKPVPLEGRMAASIFACEIAKNRCGADNCLPQRLRQITRQDVTMSFADPLDFIAKGETGIYEVDIWLNSVNPSKLKRRSRIHRPDRASGNTTFTG